MFNFVYNNIWRRHESSTCAHCSSILQIRGKFENSDLCLQQIFRRHWCLLLWCLTPIKSDCGLFSKSQMLTVCFRNGVTRQLAVWCLSLCNCSDAHLNHWLKWCWSDLQTLCNSERYRPNAILILWLKCWWLLQTLLRETGQMPFSIFG